MSDTRRKWFQIHKSTAVVMLITAVLLLGLNLIGRTGYEGYDSRIVEYGWPDEIATQHEVGGLTYSKHALLIDLLVNLITVGIAGGVCEIILRPAERRGLVQIHLSTAFFAMLLAGAFLGLGISLNGWPLDATFRGYGPSQQQILVLDVLIDAEFVLAAMVVLEAAFRRREARKP